jgi:hypothetical protein
MITVLLITIDLFQRDDFAVEGQFAEDYKK